MKAKVISFQTTQRQFCDWIRHPELELPYHFEPDRMQLYRDLLLNNVCSFIDLVFPVARAMLPSLQWQQLQVEFFQKSHCQSPLYLDISLQFREFLSAQRHPVLQQYPWLTELLHYEWLELYVDTVELDAQSDNQWPFTTQIWVLVYQYPVYNWTTVMTPEQAKPNPGAIMVWRDHSDQVHIERLSPLFAVLIEQIQQHGLEETVLYQSIQALLPDFSLQRLRIHLCELKTFLTGLRLLYVSHHHDEIQG